MFTKSLLYARGKRPKESMFTTSRRPDVLDNFEMDLFPSKQVTGFPIRKLI